MDVDSVSTGGEDAPDGRGLRYMEWSWDPDPDDTEYITTYAFVVRHADGRVEVEGDVHHNGVFPRATWLELLADAGFAVTSRVDRWNRHVFTGRRTAGGQHRCRRRRPHRAPMIVGGRCGRRTPTCRYGTRAFSASSGCSTQPPHQRRQCQRSWPRRARPGRAVRPAQIPSAPSRGEAVDDDRREGVDEVRAVADAADVDDRGVRRSSAAAGPPKPRSRMPHEPSRTRGLRRPAATPRAPLAAACRASATANATHTTSAAAAVAGRPTIGATSGRRQRSSASHAPRPSESALPPGTSAQNGSGRPRTTAPQRAASGPAGRRRRRSPRASAPAPSRSATATPDRTAPRRPATRNG